MNTVPNTSHTPEVGELRGHVDTIAGALTGWAHRDDARPCPHARAAANIAVESIDLAVATLHRLRAGLLGEIRESDDAAMARVEALLRTGRGES